MSTLKALSKALHRLDNICPPDADVVVSGNSVYILGLAAQALEDVEWKLGKERDARKVGGSSWVLDTYISANEDDSLVYVTFRTERAPVLQEALDATKEGAKQ